MAVHVSSIEHSSPPTLRASSYRATALHLTLGRVSAALTVLVGDVSNPPLPHPRPEERRKEIGEGVRRGGLKES